MFVQVKRRAWDSNPRRRGTPHRFSSQSAAVPGAPRPFLFGTFRQVTSGVASPPIPAVTCLYLAVRVIAVSTSPRPTRSSGRRFHGEDDVHDHLVGVVVRHAPDLVDDAPSTLLAAVRLSAEPDLSVERRDGVHESGCIEQALGRAEVQGGIAEVHSGHSPMMTSVRGNHCHGRLSIWGVVSREARADRRRFRTAGSP